jgi:DNA/RNA endonuclease YhcR with UshA esterase domain
MRDSGVIVIAVVCALCGIAVLCITAQKIQPALCEISSIEPGTYVACEGIVYRCRYAGTHCFVKIFDGASVDVPFFNCTDTISVGDLVYVEGAASLYRGSLEIIPETYTISRVSYTVCPETELPPEGGAHKDLGTFCAVISVEPDTCTDSQKYLDLLVSFHGRISSYTQGKYCTFQLFSHSNRFLSGDPLTLGEVSGFGVQIGEDVVVLYYQWNELPLESIAEAKERPEGYPVKVCGTIQSVHVSRGHIFLVIADSTGCIVIPVFSNKKEMLGVDADTVYVGQTLTVVGKRSVYDNVIEILPEVIT